MRANGHWNDRAEEAKNRGFMDARERSGAPKKKDPSNGGMKNSFFSRDAPCPVAYTRVGKKCNKQTNPRWEDTARNNGRLMHEKGAELARSIKTVGPHAVLEFDRKKRPSPWK